MVTLDAETAALVRLAAAIALGSRDTIQERSAEALTAGTPALWVDELLLQSVLMVGYPRALGAARIWREARGAEAEWEEDGGDQRLAPSWAARGEALCRTIYGDNYRRLRDNVRALHPALDTWMVNEGYGRTLGRPGLDLVRRELAVIAQVAVLGALPQLHSHLRGALHAGAGAGVVGEALDLALRDAAPEYQAPARALWERVRS
jgi:4-carboxymuconolactone decarboxylase